MSYDLSQLNPDLVHFLSRLELVAQQMEFGTMSCNVVIKNGNPNNLTFFIVVNRRKRFPPQKGTNTQDGND